MRWKSSKQPIKQASEERPWSTTKAREPKIVEDDPENDNEFEYKIPSASDGRVEEYNRYQRHLHILQEKEL